MSDKKMFNPSSNEKFIDNPHMYVKDNVMSFKDHFIQISNIAQVKILPELRKNIHWLAILMVALGTIAFFYGIIDSEFIIVMGGLFVTALGAAIIYFTMRKNKNRGNYLVVQLNSGSVFYFHSQSYQFLSSVLNALKSCVNNGQGSIVIDFSNSIIKDSNVLSDGSSTNGRYAQIERNN